MPCSNLIIPDYTLGRVATQPVKRSINNNGAAAAQKSNLKDKLDCLSLTGEAKLAAAASTAAAVGKHGKSETPAAATLVVGWHDAERLPVGRGKFSMFHMRNQQL
jgi:hypothetical protein